MFQLANSFDFVAYALVAASATRLATISKSEEAAQDAEKYSAMAIKGMLAAFQALTEENAEAILGAALSCSFTVSNYGMQFEGKNN
ncbi:fungal specific transcription factor domain-containing protein [Pochonia chlamydosporia 170]|uniref:Fungal specific transcription factor domain-containing protein n=1 Tax=Pochonia chlamydosporia 170 TaxID=1380566 RepID=A0A179FR26_METCM|nr:fungal specific transcription factor domain-containing protein [Pochonia chlamydosporia 170]OAQ67807.1 fungal specific transcription factor domain-containing protein [Pochonia chlamydosporia 170]